MYYMLLPFSCVGECLSPVLYFLVCIFLASLPSPLPVLLPAEERNAEYIMSAKFSLPRCFFVSSVAVVTAAAAVVVVIVVVVIAAAAAVEAPHAVAKDRVDVKRARVSVSA